MEDKGIIVLIVLTVLFFLGLIGLPIGCDAVMGVGVFGPTQSLVVTVTSKHVDASKDSSHYMVTTNQGTFEIDNGPLLGVYNADELYGQLVPGQKYLLTTKGRRVVGFFFQEYPYVVRVEPVL